MASPSPSPVSPKFAHFAPNPRPALTDAQKASFETLKSAITSEYAANSAALRFATDSTLMRYMWAHQFKVEKAKKNLADTITWRAEYIGDDLHCDACAKDEKSHCFVRLGNDRYYRPIVYFCPARCLCTDKDITVRHTVSEVEVAFSQADVAENWVWIFDLRGFSIWGSGFSIGASREVVGVFTDHYPERLAVMLMVDAPTLVSVAYQTVKTFMDPVTVRKINMIGSKDVAAAVRAVTDDPAIVGWLVAAFAAEPKPGVLPLMPVASPLPVHRLMNVDARNPGYEGRKLTLPEVCSLTASGALTPKPGTPAAPSPAAYGGAGGSNTTSAAATLEGAAAGAGATATA